MTFVSIAPQFLQAQAGTSSMASLFFIALIIVVFYFFIIRPQNKQQKKVREYQNSLKVGDEVVTTAGIHGTIKRIDNEKMQILLNVSTGTDIWFDKNAIIPR